MRINYLIIIAIASLCFLDAPAQQRAHVHINLDRTVMRINDSLKKHCDFLQQVRMENDSVFAIEDKDGLRFKVHALRLKTNRNEDKWHRNGIEFEPEVPRAHAPNSWIQFYENGKQTAFIKFTNADDAAVERIYRLFLRMYDLMVALANKRYR